MKALLVRVGIDQAFGGWNAPVDAQGKFIFVPIPESENITFSNGLQRSFGEVIPGLSRFCDDRNLSLVSQLKFPVTLQDRFLHLDPDFDQLTYGDDGANRGSAMIGMKDGDLLAFYSGLRPIYPCDHKLIYALVGLYVVNEVVSVSQIPSDRWHENAHTRKDLWGRTDIVVRAVPGISGRLKRCIQIGEWRNGAYRVCNDVLTQWGGLGVKDGFIQRSIVPPAFNDPQRFYEWFLGQGVPLLKGNGWND